MTTASANPQHREALEPSLHLRIEPAEAVPVLPQGELPEHARRPYEERLRLLVEAVEGYAIFMLDIDGNVATWSPGAQRIQGYTADEIIGRPFSVFYPEHEIRAGKAEHALRVTQRDGRFEDEGWRLRKDGSQLWASVVITALRDGDGVLLGYAEITRDLTERRRREDERLELGRAEEAVRLRDEFLALASHELRTPLTVLQLQLDALRRRLEPHEASLLAKLDRCARAGHRLAELINALLDVSRIAAGRFQLAREPCDLAEVVTAAADRLRVAAEAAGCTLSVAVAPACGRWDRSRIDQMISHLVCNAIRYAAGTAIQIAMTREHAAIVLEIRDGGPGLPDSEIARIFERFERCASIRHYGGLGLGLYVVRQIVDAHGGCVTADNPAGGGARFTVRLPVPAVNHHPVV